MKTLHFGCQKIVQVVEIRPIYSLVEISKNCANNSNKHKHVVKQSSSNIAQKRRKSVNNGNMAN